MTAAVGFVGLGQMGSRMAARLVGRDLELNVFDLDEHPVNKLVMLGAVSQSSPRAIGDTCGVVLCSLP